jgi:hypothetical protein
MPLRLALTLRPPPRSAAPTFGPVLDHRIDPNSRPANRETRA